MDSSVATHNQQHATRSTPHATSKQATRPAQATHTGSLPQGSTKNNSNAHNPTIHTIGAFPPAIDFPPPHVVLHPEDASNRVLAAIGRSLLSVGNRAMTVKDLADMVVHNGLVCQNVSAASQAITTYIRTHLLRCDAQQDCPLLLRHTLSGTAYDDDLLPALYSKAGGAQSATAPDERATNFRRGTQVWYLSKAAGAPCPFARAGIRICDYGENGKLGLLADTKDKQRQKERQRRMETCGSKRKRATRSCVTHEANEEPQPEQKVKLTLRLKPLNTPAPSPHNTTPDSASAEPIADFSADDDALGHPERDTLTCLAPEAEEPWTLPPYPRRSIAIPTYTPTFDGPYPELQPSFNTRFRRAPSMHSLASPPPESDESDDEDDYEDYYPPPASAVAELGSPIPSDGLLTTTVEDFDIDGDLDSERFDSPGPQSPPLYSITLPLSDPKVAVKQEPTVVEGLLDHWDAEYGGHTFESVYETGVKAEPEVFSRCSVPVKREWSTPSTLSDDEQFIKQEETEQDLLAAASGSVDAGFPPPTEEELSALYSQFAASFTDVPPLEHSYREREDSWQSDGPSSPAVEYPMVRPRLRTTTSPVQFPAAPMAFMTPPSLPTTRQDGWAPFTPVSPATPSLASVFASMSMESPTVPSAAVSPSALALPFSHSLPPAPRFDQQQVIVHTTEPCNPAITATQIEGICVYQTKLGDMGVLRRIDTDWVNMSAIVAHRNTPYPKMSSTVTVDQGPVSAIGTWVPLVTAQEYVRQYPCYQDELGVFLSDTLHERFPPSLQEYYRSSAATRRADQFGPKFGSTPRATALCIQSDVLQSNGPWALPSLARPRKVEEDAQKPVTESPLSPEEEEMFHGLCASPEWEVEKPASPSLALALAPDAVSKEEPAASPEVDMDASSSQSPPPLPTDDNVSTSECESPAEEVDEAPAPVRAGVKRKSPEPDTPRSPSRPLQPTHTNNPPPAKRDCGSLRRSKRVADMTRPRTRAATRRGSKATRS
ncbi:hypothetical protein HDZ31DRAFT_60620 [Schizophyllum fasciatum]